MDATQPVQPWLNTPMSGKDAQHAARNCRPAPKKERMAQPYARNEPPFTYLPWMSSTLMGR